MIIRQLKLLGTLFVIGFAMASIYSLVGPSGHASARGATIISTGNFNTSRSPVYLDGAQFPPSIPDAVNSAATFKTYIGNLLYDVSAYGIPGTDYNMYGAAFIVETMLHGQNNYGADANLVNAARAEYGTWAAYIDAYQAQGRINWGYWANMPPGTINSTHVCIETNPWCWDRAVYYNDNYGGGGYDARWFQFFNNSGYEASTLIIFTNPDGSSFMIRRECANPMGNVSPLQNTTWSGQGRTTVSDGSNTGTNILVPPGAKLTFTHYIKNNGPSTAGMWYETHGRNNDATNPWTAQYFNNTTLTPPSVLTRQEQDIAYADYVGNVSPAPGVVVPDGFSVRWTRTQNFQAGTYIFRSNSDDGERLYLDGVLILDDWVPSGAIPYDIYRTLTAGTHTIMYEYFESGGPGVASMEYTNYLVQGGTNGGSFANGEERAVNTEANVIVPGNAVPGTQFCRRILWDWRNSSASGELWLNPPSAGMGSLACATVRADFELTPAVNYTIKSNGVAISGNVAEPGDTVTFSYDVRNTGGSDSTPVNCAYKQATYTGYNTSPPGSGFTPAGASCPPQKTFPGNNATTNAATESNVPLTTANTSVCRSFTIDPVNQAGSPANRTGQSCVFVAAKPYARVYGGDVSAGNGFSTGAGTSCTTNGQAAVVGWNSESPNYSGAGAQFGVYAMKSIFDFASALGNAAGAPAGSGLAFANTAPTGGVFGGDLGAVSCLPDYFFFKPGATTTKASPIDVGTLTTGNYTGTAPLGSAVTIAGTLPGSSQAVVYVQGDVLITGDIKYPATWTSANTPLFELIVKGNIYISQTVGQLDGLYIAQRNTVTSTGGNIYTCSNTGSTPASAVLPTSPTAFTDCKKQLIVNGAFIAYAVQLLRTNGTLSQSSAGEKGDATGHAAEVFNYSPTMWMARPPGQAVTTDYDSITSLPPIL